MISKGLLAEYKQFCKSTAIYPEAGTGSEKEVLYLSLGLFGEYKEWLSSGTLGSDEKKEASDVCWYIMRLCDIFYWDYSHVFCNTIKYNLDSNIFEALKKFIRDKKDIKSILYIECMDKIAHIREYHDINELLKLNMKKLTERKNTGTLQGDGETIEERMKK